MNSIQLDFEQARAKHLLFKAKLRSILYGIEVEEGPVVSHTECAVGKWIYSHALSAYGSLSEMHELEKVHENLHSTAKKLVELYKMGKVEEARLGLTEIESIADNLVQLLSIVESKTKENNQDIKQPPDVTENLRELEDLSEANKKLDKAIRQATAETLREKWLLQEAFMHIPASISIIKGPTHIIQFANATALERLGDMTVLGKAVADVFPELKDQGFIDILDEVYQRGKPFVAKEMKAVIEIAGEKQEFYSNVSYTPIKSQDGTIEGILAFSYDVSELVKAREAAEAMSERLKQSYEDLEIKVKFRNLELEKENRSLQDQLNKNSR